jgi:hypothetical protein
MHTRGRDRAAIAHHYVCPTASTGCCSLILYATRNYGVHATGITLSSEQRAFIAERVAERVCRTRSTFVCSTTVNSITRQRHSMR